MKINRLNSFDKLFMNPNNIEFITLYIADYLNIDCNTIKGNVAILNVNSSLINNLFKISTVNVLLNSKSILNVQLNYIDCYIEEDLVSDFISIFNKRTLYNKKNIVIYFCYLASTKKEYLYSKNISYINLTYFKNHKEKSKIDKWGKLLLSDSNNFQQELEKITKLYIK